VAVGRIIAVDWTVEAGGVVAVGAVVEAVIGVLVNLTGSGVRVPEVQPVTGISRLNKIATLNIFLANIIDPW
jgi:hypothetical protein